LLADASWIRHRENIPRQSQSQQPPKEPHEQNEEGDLSGDPYNLLILMMLLAPKVGLEPATKRSFNNMQVSG
jgi:hypothetical protein